MEKCLEEVRELGGKGSSAELNPEVMVVLFCFLISNSWKLGGNVSSVVW